MRRPYRCRGSRLRLDAELKGPAGILPFAGVSPSEYGPGACASSGRRHQGFQSHLDLRVALGNGGVEHDGEVLGPAESKLTIPLEKPTTGRLVGNARPEYSGELLAFLKGLLICSLQAR